MARKKTNDAPRKRASTPTWSSRSAWTSCRRSCPERRRWPLGSLEAPGRIRPAGGFPVDLDPPAIGGRLDHDVGLDRIDRRRGRGSVLRDVLIQAGEGTEAPPAPGAEDGVPQPPAALLTVAEDRHGYSKK